MMIFHELSFEAHNNVYSVDDAKTDDIVQGTANLPAGREVKLKGSKGDTVTLIPLKNQQRADQFITTGVLCGQPMMFNRGFTN